MGGYDSLRIPNARFGWPVRDEESEMIFVKSSRSKTGQSFFVQQKGEKGQMFLVVASQSLTSERPDKSSRFAPELASISERNVILMSLAPDVHFTDLCPGDPNPQMDNIQQEKEPLFR